MRPTSSIWVLSALSTLALGSALPQSCENNTTPAGTPILSSPDSSHVTPAPALLPDGLAKPQPLDDAPISSSSVGRSPHLGSANFPRAANKAVDIAAILAGSSINLPLLSSILLSGIPEGATRTLTLNPTIILTLPRPYPTQSATRVSSALATATTSAALPPSRSTTVLPTSKATSAEPSETSATKPLASPSSSPSMSQSPEPSTASAEGHTLSTSSIPSSARSTEIPPAPSAAGASGNTSARGKERVWWVIFFTPFLLMA